MHYNGEINLVGVNITASIFVYNHVNFSGAVCIEQIYTIAPIKQ